MDKDKLVDFGRLWLASSPFTESFRNVRRGIDAGADCVVLKSTSPKVDVNKRKGGRRTIVKGLLIHPSLPIRLPDLDVNEATGELRVNRSICSTSTNYHRELLTFDEANRLYDQIKRYSPETKVVQSFAPSCKEDFFVVRELRADAIELSLIGYSVTNSRPYVLSAWDDTFHGDLESFLSDASLSDDAKTKLANGVLARKEKSRIVDETMEALPQLSLGVPLLLKLPHHPEEICLDFEDLFTEWIDGFTFSDSRKLGSYKSLGGIAVHDFGKCSLSGEPLFHVTKPAIEGLRSRHPNMYLSASGGIMTPENALEVLDAGADSVQLCSALFYDGFRAVSNIKGALMKK